MWWLAKRQEKKFGLVCEINSKCQQNMQPALLKLLSRKIMIHSVHLLPGPSEVNNNAFLSASAQGFPSCSCGMSIPTGTIFPTAMEIRTRQKSSQCLFRWARCRTAGEGRTAMWYSMGKRLWKNGRYSVHGFCNWATECSLNMRTWVFNCNLHELSISTYKQLRTVKPCERMYLIVFTWFFFYILQCLFMIIYLYIVL